MADDALARRMFEAQQRREAVVGRRLTLEEIAGEVAVRVGRAAPAPSVVRRWLKGKAEPDRPTLAALAGVFGVDPGWLAFGEGSGLRRLPDVPESVLEADRLKDAAAAGAPDVHRLDRTAGTQTPPAGKRRAGGGGAA